MLVIVTSGCETKKDKNRQLFWHYCNEQDRLVPVINDALKYSLPMAKIYIRKNKALVDSMNKYFYLAHPELIHPIHKMK